jgi:hypothetical protein
MVEQQHHEMILEVTHASGMEGWYCPACGRRILLLVPPDNQMVVVDDGDRYASHSGSIGDLQIGGVKVTRQDKESQEMSEERLRPWLKAIEKLDIDW